jgi:hypothetical protein
MPVPAPLLHALDDIVGSTALLTSAKDVVPYGFDGTAIFRQRPGAVVFPRTTSEVARCVRAAIEHGTPIVTRGSGTGLSGGSVPDADSLVICLAQMRTRAVGRMLRWYQRTGAEAVARRLGLTRLLPAAIARLEPQTPRIAPAFSSAPIARHEAPAASHTVGDSASASDRAPRYRAVLRLLPDVSLVDLPESSWCCGSAGIYNITQPEQSAALLARKVAHVRATGASVLATANPGCRLQIARGLAAAGTSIAIVPPVSLLARAYRRARGSRRGARSSAAHRVG